MLGRVDIWIRGEQLLTSACPICLPSPERVAFAGALIKGVWSDDAAIDGRLLLTPHRHVARWSELHESEQLALVQGIEKGRALLIERFAPDGLHVGFDEEGIGGLTNPHFHFHIIPRRPEASIGLTSGVQEMAGGAPYFGDISLSKIPGDTPHSGALIAGGEDALVKHLLPHIDRASKVDVAISFVMESGVRLLRPHLQDLLDRKGELRFLTGDYLDVTDPDALRRLMDLDGKASLYVFETGAVAFHPKSWVFHFEDGAGIALVGSSNLSETALRTGVEWNYRTYTPDQRGGWADVLTGFEALIARSDTKPLTHDWIDAYERRRRTQQLQPQLKAAESAEEAPAPRPEPHAIQRRALAALEETRREGFTAGLVVLATGLGKTWLSAFDSDRPEFRRILFVAHREEILTQAMETFRICRPRSRLGRYTGSEKDLSADVLFASIQTLGRATHLRQFPADAFDYVIVDEFHHAAARTYRGLINHFTPKFLLGLTATPDRMDGGDLLGLCQENLVFRCDAFEGIQSGLLSQFSYFGVPDDVDYSNIPWRSTGFDETQLTAALATQTRAQNALEQHRRLGGTRTLAFCSSQRHADFMADYFNGQGLRTVAVHSGASSAPRASSLEKLQSGDLDVVFAVDMFNEGVDVPAIDTVLMLRPTESTTIWMQQFGRGLRRAEGKERLNVIDYIGNHRIFLTKARAMLNCSDGDRALAMKLQELKDGRLELPPGCDVTYDLRALDILQNLLRSTAHGDAFEAFYIDFKQRIGERPTALEMFHAGFKPRASGHGGWFDFVQMHGDLAVSEVGILRGHRDFLDELAKTPMTKSYKMLLLQAMLQEGRLPGEIDMALLVARFSALAKRHPAFRTDVSVDLDDLPAVWGLLQEHPINAWTSAKGHYFSATADHFRTTFNVAREIEPAFSAMVQEVIEWRLAEYLAREIPEVVAEPDLVGVSDSQAAEFVHDTATGAIPWREYSREEIPPHYGHRFSTAHWNQGFIIQGRDVFLLATLEKRDLMADHKYDDGFIDAGHFRWQSQNRTAQASPHGRIINQTLPGYSIHLFVRPTKKRGAISTPFYYCGDVDFEEWQGEKPITVTWTLREPVPKHLWRVLKLENV